jgi:hypothetical protein
MKQMIKAQIFLVMAFSVLLGLFSAGYAQNNELKALLRKPFHLTPDYKVGDKDFYRIQTIYLDMNDAGHVAQTRILDGYFSKEMMRLEQDKKFYRFNWKYVKTGMRQGKGKIEEYEILSFTKGFQYELSYGNWIENRFPIDFSPIPKTMTGWTFVVKVIDAHTFDIIASLDNYDKKLERLGDSASLPDKATVIPMDFPPLFTDTHFIQAPFFASLHGITLFKDEPCAILAFRSDDCRVRMVANINNMKLPTEGVSYYLGEIFISLETGKILWGKILERVDSITSLLAKEGTPMKHVTQREITLERMERKDYEQVR